MNGRLDILEAICQHSNFTNTCTTTINVRDIYGRTPLHYAAMKGYDDCVSYLLDQHADIEARDLDGFSPLVCAIINGRTVSVDILLNAGANIEPENDKDHIPLSLACFYGHTDIALMLYHRGAKTRCDRELLYPLHLVAQKGHVELCRILSKDHEYLDKPDIYYNWTPLFWAANYGHIECVRILISEGCQLNLKDGNGKTALHYAAWEGHTKCAQLMMDAGCHGNVDAFPPKESIYQNIVNDINKHPITQPPSLNDDIIMEENLDIPLELDNIPSLELPPPIIPFRIYGHNYLDKKYQIHIMLKQPPIRLYDNTPISSIKLVISMKPDIGVIPHSLILPLAHRRENIYFHIDSLDNFLLEFDVLPTFGKRILGRGVLPVCDFKISEGHRIIPLLDTHLNAVGELVFDYCIIKPFLGVQLEIGGRIETYWKSKMIGATLLTGVTENLKPATAVSSFVTASSLSGDYVHLVVQLTKDRVPIIFTNWMIPCDGLDLAVSDLALHQINQLVANFLSQGVGNLHDFTGNVYLIDDFKLEREVLTLQKALQKWVFY
ncbi:ankyrin repeat-containing domain protein [Mycotypha africana]|uniref:ankyrin repeat-containing domain protein n=1 Tax=Mycotypha africana TaxID=64632 RepID=UPI002301CFB1|nr:ankyrin repeat-containing domain protein [Mycotypha africana]KAI8969043.1 ankyrin repeat-containing domain protein [Mycotypha africana]